MVNLRHDLFPYLRVHLSQQQIEGRAHSNRRPLTVDEKLGIGLITCGGCSLAGVLLGFNVGHTCALKTIDQFFDAVFVSEVGKIHFPDTLQELQLASDLYLAKKPFHRYYFGHIGALDGLAVRIPMPSKKETDNPLDFMTRKRSVPTIAKLLSMQMTNAFHCQLSVLDQHMIALHGQWQVTARNGRSA